MITYQSNEHLQTPHSPLQLHQQVPFPPLHHCLSSYDLPLLMDATFEATSCPGRLADGSVCFNPVINGQEMAPLEFTNVLYVPAWCSNLFSVLYLTLHCISLCALSKTLCMHFIRDNKIDFQAKTGASNSAFLVGDTIPVEEVTSLSSASTLPLDWNLWHHCLCHHHLAGINKLHLGNRA